MLRAVALGLLISLFVVLVSGTDNELASCNCDDEGLWSVHSILECQKVSDFFIAVAYFSIPIELLYFISCSNVPFKWVLVQFIAFIVLCGLTHLLNGWTYYGPHSFQLMLSLTIAKLLTALVSCATAITLLTLIPLLLKVKVREIFLRQNVLELDQEVDMMKRKKEAGSHVRMLTQEIRKSLDKHTILYTTLVELSKTLDLINCAVWMPNENGTHMNLTHELKASSSRSSFHQSIPMSDPDVKEIKGNEGVRILRPDSALGLASGTGSEEAGAVAAIRMPMLQGYNFKGGTPELVETCYAILGLNRKEILEFRACLELFAQSPCGKLLVSSSSLHLMMQGNVWISTNSVGFAQSMTLLLRFRGLRVLLADDDDINRTVTKKLLEKLGCEVTAVSSGFECLSAVSHAENSFRIVVLDLHMPEMDGFEVAMRIRKFRSRNWPLIIALTASAEDHVRERCLQIGMNAILQKPVLLQGMADELRRVLQRTGEGI
ncbi:hypothetical protein GOBAR_DD30300 [Gossypium barbadense]|nr:hypothetical protein GOBAR_DD30300 [Gossypium barbadense]